MIERSIKVMMGNYYNDHDGFYLTSLEFLIDKLREENTFKNSLEKTRLFSEDLLGRFITEIASNVGAESEEINLEIEKAKKSYEFNWIFDEITGIYNEYGQDGLFQLFFVKYKAMKNERIGFNNNDEDEED